MHRGDAPDDGVVLMHSPEQTNKTIAIDVLSVLALFTGLPTIVALRKEIVFTLRQIEKHCACGGTTSWLISGCLVSICGICCR